MSKKFIAIAMSVVMTTSLLTGMMVVNAETLENVYDTSAFEVSPLFEADFEKASINDFGIIEKQSYASTTDEEIVEGPKDAKNKVLHITRTENTKALNTLVSIPFTETAITKGTVEVELDLYAATDAVGVGVDGDGDWSVAALAKLTDGISAYNGSSGKAYNDYTVSKTDWTHIKYQINVEDKTYNLWVGNHQCATNYAFRDSNTNNSVKYITFWLANVTDKVEMYVDNITVKHSLRRVIADDSFNRSESVLNGFWAPIISNNTNGLSLVNRNEGSDSDKAVFVDTTNSNFDGVKYTFGDTANSMLLSVDYKIPSSGGRPFTISFDGTGDNKNSALISVTITHSNIKYVTQGLESGAAAKGVALKSGMTNSDWQNIKFAVYTKDNTVSVFHNDEYIGIMPFRHYRDTKTLNTVSIGGGTKTTSTTEGMYFDNIKLINIGTELPIEISDVLKSYDFNGSTEALPTGFTGSGSLELKDGTSGTDRELKLTSAAGNSKVLESWFQLDKAVTTGHLNITYKFKVNNNSNIAKRFYLYSNNTIILGANIASGKLSMTGSVPKPADCNIKVNEENSVTFHIDVDEKTYAYTLNNNAKTRYYPLRNQADMKNGVTKGYFGIAANTGTESNEFCVDDFVIAEDITNYGPMELSSKSPVCVDAEKRTVAGVADGTTVSGLLGYLSTEAVNANIYMTDFRGTEKASNETVEPGDVVVLEKMGVYVAKRYTLLPNFEMSFRSLVVNGDEYFEEDSIPVNGTTVVRTALTNNTPNNATFDLCAAIIGNKLYDVKYENDVTVKALTTQGVSTDLTIPNVEEDVTLKVMLFESDGSFKPVLEYISKLSVAKPEISMGEIFTDHMVLQREADVNIFGIAPAGSNIRVEFDGESVAGVATANNEFLVQLPPMEASSEGKNLVVTVTNNSETKTFIYTDVVVGDVFYGSGQSNMQNTVDWFKTAGNSKGPYKNTETGIEFVENVRYYNMTSKTSTTTNKTFVWEVPTQANYGTASATLLTTAAALRKLGAVDSDVPIGLVKCAVGSTSISMWTGADVLLKPAYSEWHDSYWKSDKDNNKARLTDFYYAMVKSIMPYTFKAAIWYQGEADVDKAFYDNYAADMIKQMRADFGYEIPYIIVQLPGFANGKQWDNFRLVQWNIPNIVDNTYVAVTNDTGTSSDIHPNDKVLVGDRIARQIMKNVYGINNIPYTGPVFNNASANGSVVTVECDYVNDGTHGVLTLKNNNQCEGFEVSEDGVNYYDATSVSISGNTFVVSSTSVSSPKYIRYGYVDTPIKNAGSETSAIFLPLAPFSEEIQ